MSFYSQDITDQVDEVCRIRYMARDDVNAWNRNRRDGELRLLSGWMWTAKNGSAYQQGLKTRSAAIRDAYYVLIVQSAAPGNVTRRAARLRVVA
jgi:hypothetical protein